MSDIVCLRTFSRTFSGDALQLHSCSPVPGESLVVCGLGLSLTDSLLPELGSLSLVSLYETVYHTS